MTTPDWATKRAWELIEMDQRNGGVSVLAGYIAQALRVERREAYERGAADMKERAARVCTGWFAEFGDFQPEHVSARKWASDAVQDLTDAIRALPAPAALEEKKP